MSLTQKTRVLSLLRAAGSAGVRSDHFLSISIPRAAARILELREEGYEISAQREKQFTRYRLMSAGVGVGVPGPDQAVVRGASANSGTQAPVPNEHVPGGDSSLVMASGDHARLFELPAPSIYNAWETA